MLVRVFNMVLVWMLGAGLSTAAAQGTATPSPQNAMSQDILRTIIEFALKYSLQAVGGIIVLVIGWFIAKYIADLSGKFLQRKNVDVVVARFLCGTVKLLIMAFAVIMALSKFGIEIAPLIAGVSVAGFGLSFALQGPLSNYASGATLIFTKPFKVGDIIEVAGVMGEVLDMKLPRTEIKTVDGTLIVVPNKHIIGEVIHNCSHFKKVDITVGVSYSSDMQKVIEVVRQVILADKRITDTMRPKVGIKEFADFSVNIMARFWCLQDDYYDVLFGINKGIFDAFQKQGINIPFPQRDVHIIKGEV